MTYRINYNNQSGLLAADPGAYGTSIFFASPPNFASITIPGSYIPLVLDAGTSRFEVVYLTGYTAGNYSGTILRAAEDSANWPSVAHPNGTWTCAPTAGALSSSFLRVNCSGTLTAPGPSIATIIPFNLTNNDYGGNFNTSTYTYTAPISGAYSVLAQVKIQVQNNPQLASLRLYLDGVPISLSDQTFRGVSAGDYVTLVLADAVGLVKGDTLTLYLWNGSSSSITTYSGSGESHWSIWKVA